MTKAAIFDMDGTLCDVSSVRYHVNPKDPRFSGRKRFDRFHAGSIDCPANGTALTYYLQARNEGLAILVVTARKVFWRYTTIVWLRENQIHYDELYMRRNTDNRVDVECKRAILSDIRRDGYDPVMAVDDNPAIIDLWRGEGIPTHVIAGWEED